MAPKATFIALVKIKEWNDYISLKGTGSFATSMKVKLLKTYKGKPRHKIITLWGDNGAQCRPYISNFPVGDYFLIAFYAVDKGDQHFYYINNCGCYYLKANKKDKTLTGDIDNGNMIKSTADFDEVIKKLKSK